MTTYEVATATCLKPLKRKPGIFVTNALILALYLVSQLDVLVKRQN
jgi:hypothetical protein